jgi:type III secretion system FlhB-like substrate exporter
MAMRCSPKRDASEIPVVEDASMVDQLIGHAIGDRIPQETYTPVARLLVRFGV